jgi:hypothetical protein
MAAVGGLALYVLGGWVLLTHVVSAREAPAATPQGSAGPSAGITISVLVIDGPNRSCATSAGTVDGDTIVIAAREVPELFRQLKCWNAADP